MAIEINNHNFNNSIQRIKEFSKTTPSLPQIRTYGEKKLKFFDHTITGKEMNEFVKDIQPFFIEQNSAIIKIYREFGEIYKTFNYLDKEYIDGIIGSVNAAKAASDGALEAAENAKAAFDKALKNENDIKLQIEALKKIVSKLMDVNNDLNECSSIQEELSISLPQLKADIENLHKDFTNIIEHIQVNELQYSEQFTQLNLALKNYRLKNNTILIISVLSILCSIFAILF